MRVRFSRSKTMAEREGFEPPDPCGSTVFKTAAIDHSAISPEIGGDYTIFASCWVVRAVEEAGNRLKMGGEANSSVQQVGAHARSGISARVNLTPCGTIESIESTKVRVNG